MTAYTNETAEDIKAKKRLTDLERVKKLNRDKAVQELYKTKEGRTYLFHLLEKTGVFGVNAFSSDALQTAFVCGQQYVGQQLMAHMLEVNPEGFSALLLEMSSHDRYISNQHNIGSGNAAARDDYGDEPEPVPSSPNPVPDREDEYYN